MDYLFKCFLASFRFRIENTKYRRFIELNRRRRYTKALILLITLNVPTNNYLILYLWSLRPSSVYL